MTQAERQTQMGRSS